MDGAGIDSAQAMSCPAVKRRRGGPAAELGAAKSAWEAWLEGPTMQNALTFLRVAELPAAARASRRLREQTEDPTLWRALHARRRRPVSIDISTGGICGGRDSRADLKQANENWKVRYRAEARAEQVARSPRIEALRSLVPGLRGRLQQMVSVRDDRDWLAARCALRQDPLIVEDVASAIACVTLARERGFNLSVMPLDGVCEDPELEARLSRIRQGAIDNGGSCRPLLDAFCPPGDVAYGAGSEHRIQAVLRAFLGDIAVCEEATEAEAVCLREHCDVICSGGSRIAEFEAFGHPQVRWVTWLSGEVVW